MKVLAMNRTSMILLVSLSICACARSTSYDNSFIRFHLYGTGEPVFILSGGPGNNCMQEEDVAIKVGEHYQAILLEQRGTGLSMPPVLNKSSINLDAYLKDILFVMDSLKLSQATFYGHSWGAMYATAFAIQYPDKVKELVLTGPGYMKLEDGYQRTIVKNRMEKLNEVQRKRFDKLSKKNMKQWSTEEQQEAADLRATFNTYDTTNKAWKFAKIQKGKTNQQTNDLMMEDLARIHFDLTPQLPKLPMPITIITCKEDPMAFLTHEFQKYAPQSKVLWLDNCGHFPMYEQPERFYVLLMNTLAQ